MCILKFIMYKYYILYLINQKKIKRETFTTTQIEKKNLLLSLSLTPTLPHFSSFSRLLFYLPYTPRDNSTSSTLQQLFRRPTPITFSSLIILLICILLCQELCPIKPTLVFPCSAMIEASWSILFHLVKQLPCCCLLAP